MPGPSWVPLRSSSSSDEEDGSSQPTLFEAALQCVSLPRRAPLRRSARRCSLSATRLRRHRRTSVEDWQSGLKKATVLNQTKDKYVHMNAMAGRSLKDLHQAGHRSGETRDEVVHP